MHRLTGRGAYSTILSLVLSAYLSDSSPSLLSAAGMAAATVPQLADLARIRTHVEKNHPTLGSAVRVGEKDEEAFEVLDLLVGVLRETGAVLQQKGAASLGVWVRGALERAEGQAGAFVREVSRTFVSLPRGAHHRSRSLPPLPPPFETCTRSTNRRCTC